MSKYALGCAKGRTPKTSWQKALKHGILDLGLSEYEERKVKQLTTEFLNNKYITLQVLLNGKLEFVTIRGGEGK